VHQFPVPGALHGTGKLDTGTLILIIANFSLAAIYPCGDALRRCQIHQCSAFFNPGRCYI